jgi:hypothetical protein
LIAGVDDEESLSDVLRDFKKFTNKALVDAIKTGTESRFITDSQTTFYPHLYSR